MKSRLTFLAMFLVTLAVAGCGKSNAQWYAGKWGYDHPKLLMGEKVLFSVEFEGDKFTAKISSTDEMGAVKESDLSGGVTRDGKRLLLSADKVKTTLRTSKALYAEKAPANAEIRLVADDAKQTLTIDTVAVKTTDTGSQVLPYTMSLQRR